MPKIDLEQAYIDLKQRYDKLEENMSATETNLRKEIDAKQVEVKQREDRIAELQTEITGLKVELSKKDGDRDVLNEKIAQLQKQIEQLEGDKARLVKEKDDLVGTFKSEQDRNTEQMQNLHAHLDRVEEQLKILGEKDKIVREKDADLAQKDSLYAEKENLLKAKMTADTKAQNLEKEVQELRRKMRESGDGLLGASMEIESLKEKLRKSEEEMKKIQDRVLSLTTGNTGIIMEMPDLVKTMKDKFLQGKRNIRVVMPNVTDFERHGFIDLLEKLPPQAVVYLAAAMDPAAHEDLMNNLREKKVQLTNFQEGDTYGLNVDGALCLLTLVATDDPNKILAGFYTDIEGVVPIFKDAIQKAWVKGTKM